MARLVMVKGESAWDHVIDLDKNPWAEEQIAAGKLTLVRELDELPPDPWAAKKPARKAEAKSDAKAEAERKAAEEAEAAAAAEAEKAKAEAEKAKADAGAGASGAAEGKGA